MKRSLSLLFALLLTATAAASCGEIATEQPKETAPSTAAVTDEAVTVDEFANSEYQKPEKDLGGTTFTFLDYYSTDNVWMAQDYRDFLVEGENGDPVNDAQYKRNLKVEEVLNVHLDGIRATELANRGSGHPELNKLIQAGDDSIDAAFVFFVSLPSLITDKGKLADLSAINSLNIHASWWDQSAVEEFTLGNQLKVLTGDLNFYNTFSPIMYYFSKEVAAAYDIEDLYALVRDGKWTNEKMISLCKLVAGDVNGDNVMDEQDRYGLAEQRNLLSDFVTSGGQRYSRRDSDGNIFPSLNTEATASIVDTIVPFLNDKTICCAANDFKSKYSNVFRQLHIPMFMNGQLLFNMNQLLIAFELRSMEADFGILPCPKYDEAQAQYSTPLSTWWATTVCVPEMNPDKETAGYVLDAMGYFSQQYVTTAFIDQTVTNKALRDKDSEEMLNIILSNKYYDVALIYNWGNYTNIMATLGETNKTDFASRYAKTESKIQAALDETLSQLAE